MAGLLSLRTREPLSRLGNKELWREQKPLITFDLCDGTCSAVIVHFLLVPATVDGFRPQINQMPSGPSLAVLLACAWRYASAEMTSSVPEKVAVANLEEVGAGNQEGGPPSPQEDEIIISHNYAPFAAVAGVGFSILDVSLAVYAGEKWLRQRKNEQKERFDRIYNTFEVPGAEDWSIEEMETLNL